MPAPATPPFRLDGKVAAITGGTRSIGRGMADAFVREGASVVVNGRDAEKGQQCLDEMGAGDRAAFYAGDATEQSAVEGLVDFAIDHYGQLDIMVLNSGGVKMTYLSGELERRRCCRGCSSCSRGSATSRCTAAAN